MIKDLESGSKRGPKMELLFSGSVAFSTSNPALDEVLRLPKDSWRSWNGTGKKVIVNKTGGKNKKWENFVFNYEKGEKKKPYNLG